MPFLFETLLPLPTLTVATVGVVCPRIYGGNAFQGVQGVLTEK